jgi:hypothetical protein
MFLRVVREPEGPLRGLLGTFAGMAEAVTGQGETFSGSKNKNNN